MNSEEKMKDNNTKLVLTIQLAICTFFLIFFIFIYLFIFYFSPSISSLAQRV